LAGCDLEQSTVEVDSMTQDRERGSRWLPWHGMCDWNERFGGQKAEKGMPTVERMEMSFWVNWPN